MTTTSKFPVEKVLSLAFLGAGWNGAELVFSALTFDQTKELSSVDIDDSKENAEKNSEFILKFLSEHFIRGKAWNGQTLVDLTPEDLRDLPVEVINKSVQTLAGTPDPKS